MGQEKEQLKLGSAGSAYFATHLVQQPQGQARQVVRFFERLCLRGSLAPKHDASEAGMAPSSARDYSMKSNASRQDGSERVRHRAACGGVIACLPNVPLFVICWALLFSERKREKGGLHFLDGSLEWNSILVLPTIFFNECKKGGNTGVKVKVRLVMGNYFESMNTPLRRGWCCRKPEAFPPARRHHSTTHRQGRKKPGARWRLLLATRSIPTHTRPPNFALTRPPPTTRSTHLFLSPGYRIVLLGDRSSRGDHREGERQREKQTGHTAGGGEGQKRKREDEKRHTSGAR